MTAFWRLHNIVKKTWSHSAKVVNAALCNAAREMKLAREDNYVHVGVGCSEQDLIIVVATGRPEHIGALGRKAGAHAMILTENGGSVAIGRRADGSWMPLFSSWYFRKPTLVMAIFALRDRALPTPPGLSEWGMTASDFVGVHEIF